jgi:hypothetical protein
VRQRPDGRALVATVLACLCVPFGASSQANTPPLPDSTLNSFNPGIFWTDLGFTVVYDTNFELTQMPLAGPGLLADLRAQLRTSSYRPLLLLEYRGQMRQFKASEQWNRDNHFVNAVMEQRIGPIGIEAIGSLQLNSQTEDREFADVYSISPRISLRLGSTRLRWYWRHWARQFDHDSAEEERIRTVGGEFRWRVASPLEWQVGYRQEKGESNSPYRRFERRSASARLRVNLTNRTAIILESDRRERTYPDRRVEVQGVEVPTEDLRWTPRVYLQQGLPWGPEFRIGYEYQTRTSNDPRREYVSHRAILGFRAPLFNWDRQEHS